MYLLNQFAARWKKEAYKKSDYKTAKKALKIVANEYEGSYLPVENVSGKYGYLKIDKNKATTLARDNIKEINQSLNAKIKEAVDLASQQSKGFSNKAPNTSRQQRIEDIKFDRWNRKFDAEKEAKSTSKLLNKTKLLTKRNLAIGAGALAATGLAGYAINKLRKSRADKNKKRGKYNKFK